MPLDVHMGRDLVSKKEEEAGDVTEDDRVQGTFTCNIIYSICISTISFC